MTVNYLLYHSREARKARAAAAANARQQAVGTTDSDSLTSYLTGLSFSDCDDTSSIASDTACSTGDYDPPQYEASAHIGTIPKPPPYETPNDSLSEAEYEWDYDEEVERAELKYLVSSTPPTLADELTLKRESVRFVHRSVYSQATMLRYCGHDPERLCKELNTILAQSHVHGSGYELADTLRDVEYKGTDTASSIYASILRRDARITEKKRKMREKRRRRKEKRDERRAAREQERKAKAEEHASSALFWHELFCLSPKIAATIVAKDYAELQQGLA
ncbi:unnamed protein product [Peniophora sp. CBMAI 1063]|nr:unnamed protein product [Peniophora sp. CBMAI 1063]